MGLRLGLRFENGGLRQIIKWARYRSAVELSLAARDIEVSTGPQPTTDQPDLAAFNPAGPRAPPAGCAPTRQLNVHEYFSFSHSLICTHHVSPIVLLII